MPPKGYRNVSIKESVYRKIERFMIEENAKAGYRKYRSIAEIIEKAIEEYLEKHGYKV